MPTAAKVMLLFSILLGMQMLILSRGTTLTPRFNPRTVGGVIAPFGPNNEAGPSPHFAAARPSAAPADQRLGAEVERVMADLATLGFSIDTA